MSHVSTKRAILKFLNAIPECRAIGYPGTRLRRGQPDIMCVYLGMMYFFEVKVGHDKLSALQSEELKKWRAAGAGTGVVGSVDEVRLWFDLCIQQQKEKRDE